MGDVSGLLKDSKPATSARKAEALRAWGVMPDSETADVKPAGTSAAGNGWYDRQHECSRIQDSSTWEVGAWSGNGWHDRQHECSRVWEHSDAIEDQLFSLLSGLLGDWRDAQGSRYNVTAEEDLAKGLSVVTMRPSGQVMRTRRLIRVSGSCIVWGQKPSYFMKTPSQVGGEAAQWLVWECWENKRKPFRWARDKADTSEADSTVSMNNSLLETTAPSSADEEWTEACDAEDTVEDCGV